MVKRTQTELDTSVRATFKNGTSKDFTSIEEASNDTGISIAAIKIRCNKPGTGGKDKTTFEWLNDTTARHYRAKKSKNKGAGLEAEVVSKLKEIGYSGVCRAAGESKNLDASKVDIADINHELEVAIQCKHYAKFPNYFNIKDECTDSRDFVLVWKKSAQAGENSKGTVAVLDIDFFYKLLKTYHEYGNK